MSLGRKLTLCFIAIVLLVVAVSYSSFRTVQSLGGMLDVAANATVRKADLVAGIETGFQTMSNMAKRSQLAHAITALEKSTATTTMCSGCHTPTEAEEDRKQFELAAASVRKDLAELRPMVTDDTGRQALTTLEAGVGKWTSLYSEYLQKAHAKDFTGAHEVITERLLPILADIDKTTKMYSDLQHESLATSGAAATAMVSRSRWSAITLSAIAAFVSAIVFFVIGRASTGLRLLSNEIADKAGEVASAATRVSSSSEVLAQDAAAQTGSLTLISTSTEEISTTARKNTENARSSAAVTGDVARSIADADAKLQELMAAVRDIENSSGRIANIMKVIDEIAFQTNLLALNAAIEAARAGEAGLGFAVVADQVRNLAQRSADSARETAELIEASITASRNGVAKLDGVTDAFHAITRSAETVKSLAADVQNGSLAQAGQIDQIAEKIVHMREVTERTTSGARDGAQAGEELLVQSDGMKEIVRRLIEVVGK